MHIPNIVRSLKGNHTATFRDSESILKKCKPTLPLKLLERLRTILYNENPAKFYGYTTAAERAEYRNYDNHSTIIKNKSLVAQVINKEERNKYVMVLPS